MSILYEKIFTITVSGTYGVCHQVPFPDALCALAKAEGWTVREGEAMFEGGKRAIILIPPKGEKDG